MFGVSVVCLLYLHDITAWQIRSHRTTSQHMERSFMSLGFVEERFNLIFPGTKWCGSGSIAQEFNDLGTLETTDVCCRDHDNCNDVIEAGQSAHGLTNTALYTRVSCECDQKFLDCLRMEAAQSAKEAYLIGLIYFDALSTQCFREDYPIVRCDKYFSYTRRCKEYEFNTTASKQYQWFDVPLFHA